MQASEMVTQTPACEKWSSSATICTDCALGKNLAPVWCLLPGSSMAAAMATTAYQHGLLHGVTDEKWQRPQRAEAPQECPPGDSLGELKMQGAVPRQMGIYLACQV